MNKKYQHRKKQYNITYYKKHSCAVKAKTKQYRLSHAKQVAIYMANYYRKNKQCLIEKASRHQLLHREQHNKATVRWKKSHPEAGRAYKSQRRNRTNIKMSQEDRLISIAYRKAIKKDHCKYCGADGEHDDHYRSLAMGGTDHWWNLVRACRFCNIRKGIKHGDDFIQSLKADT